MKKSKEEVQKIILAAIMGAAVIYGYFSLLLWPLQAQQESMKQKTVDLEPEITKAKGIIAKAKATEQSAKSVTTMVAQIQACIPQGAPIAWFPTRISTFFKERGVEKIASPKFTSEGVEKELPTFKRTTWTVDVPKVDFAKFAPAIADLESQEPLVEVAGLILEASTEDPEFQRGTLNLMTLVYK